MINITIEPTNLCNAKCFYCILGQEPSFFCKQRAFMSLNTHNKLFEELDDFMSDFSCAPTFDKNIYLRYCGIGEPTLHPSLMDMFEEGLSHPLVKQVAILSNGSGWSKNFIDNFINVCRLYPNKPVELIFSLDTVNQETQVKIKKLNNIHVITKQIIYLLEKKIKNALLNLHPVFQMIVLEENLQEVGDFCHFWKKEADARGLSVKIVSEPDYPKYFLENDCFIWLKRCDSVSALQKKYIELHQKAIICATTLFLENTKYRIPLETDNSSIENCQNGTQFTQVCSIFWYGINVSANTEISPCCADTNFELRIGSLKEHTLREIYQGDIMKSFRMKHIRLDLKELQPCRSCNISYKGPPVLAKDIAEYIKVVNAKI